MTVITIFAAGNMRRVLPGGNRAIVAGRTGSDDLGMIDSVRWRPDNVVMTVFANV